MYLIVSEIPLQVLQKTGDEHIIFTCKAFRSREVVGVAPRNCKLNASCMSPYTSDLVLSSLLVPHSHLMIPLVNSILQITKLRFREV